MRLNLKKTKKNLRETLSDCKCEALAERAAYLRDRFLEKSFNSEEALVLTTLILRKVLE